MGVILHPERDHAQMIDRINQRIAALEQWSGSVMRSAGSIHGGNSAGNPGKTYVNQPGPIPFVVQDGAATPVSDSLTFTVTYTGQYLLLGTVQIFGPTVGTNGTAIFLYLDGNQPADGPDLSTQTPNGEFTLPIIYSTQLAAGTHTFEIRMTTGSGSTVTIAGFDLYIFAMGA